MAKSKQTTVFKLEGGRQAVFYQSKFKDEVNNWRRRIAAERNNIRGATSIVFKTIAKELFSPSNEDDLYSEAKRVSNWYRNNNGPSDLEDIYALATIFGLDDKEAFLKELEKSKEEENVNTPVPGMVNVALDESKLIRAMRNMKEKEAAYELYSAFVDLMGAYLKSDLDVWFEHEEGTQEWAEALAAFPKRLPVECAIRKAKMYVSENTIYKANNLLEAMYGPKDSEVDEPSEYKTMLTYRLSGFCCERYEMYDQYLNDKGIEKDSDEAVRDSSWCDFIVELNESWWDKLEDAFEEYLP